MQFSCKWIIVADHEHSRFHLVRMMPHTICPAAGPPSAARPPYPCHPDALQINIFKIRIRKVVQGPLEFSQLLRQASGLTAHVFRSTLNVERENNFVNQITELIQFSIESGIGPVYCSFDDQAKLIEEASGYKSRNAAGVKLLKDRLRGVEDTV